MREVPSRLRVGLPAKDLEELDDLPGQHTAAAAMLTLSSSANLGLLGEQQDVSQDTFGAAHVLSGFRMSTCARRLMCKQARHGCQRTTLLVPGMYLW